MTDDPHTRIAQLERALEYAVDEINALRDEISKTVAPVAGYCADNVGVDIHAVHPEPGDLFVAVRTFPRTADFRLADTSIRRWGSRHVTAFVDQVREAIARREAEQISKAIWSVARGT